ncbi:MAG: sugar ABC transporter ATP-binding protein, partial [Planctomicrobium sp.]|nr:sugar ABC transporter ATP-binding protein [Planctomicrobium sp.]
MLNTPLEPGTPLLEMRGISKSFSTVQVLDGVSLTLDHGEVLALLGENGAGKSTLMKILCGIYRPTLGDVIVNGETLKPGNAQAAQRAGVSVIHQE